MTYCFQDSFVQNQEKTFIFHKVFIGNWIRYDVGKSFFKEDPVYKDSYIKLLGNVFLNIAQQKRNELNDQ